MKAFILVLLLAVVVACAYSKAIASPDIDEEELIDKRNIFDKIKHGIEKAAKDVGKTAKKVVKKVGDEAKKVGENIGKTAKKIVKKVGETAKKVGKDIGKTSKKVVNDIVKTFKVEGKFVNHFVTKSGKEVGHFFAKEGKQIGHTLVVAGKKIEHTGKDVYEVVRDEVKKQIKNIDYDAVLHKLVSMIDSSITELACAEISKKAVVAIQPELEPAVIAAGPVIKKICSVALHLIEMGAEEGIKHVHIKP